MDADLRALLNKYAKAALADDYCVACDCHPSWGHAKDCCLLAALSAPAPSAPGEAERLRALCGEAALRLAYVLKHSRSSEFASDWPECHALIDRLTAVAAAARGKP